MDLAKYLIPEETIATESLSDTMKGLSVLGVILLGLGLSISDWKRDNENKHRQAEEAKKLKSEAKARAAWFDTIDGKACKRRLQKKYGQEIDINSTKLKKAIVDDIIKIGKKINSDKALCRKWMDEYLQYAKSDLYSDESEIPEYVYDDIKEIGSGPCATSPEDYSNGNNWTWAISDLEQLTRTWVCNERLFPLYENALNTKYADEISWGILSAFKWVGDGDEGLIGTAYHAIFDHIRGA